MTKDLFRQIRERLSRGEPFALATVVSRSGSGPRAPGATMVIGEGGETFGTIGGGWLEAEAVRISGDVIRTARPLCRTLVLTDREASREGMVCGGTVEILLDPADGRDPVWRDMAEQAHKRLEAGRAVWLVRSIRRRSEDGPGGDRSEGTRRVETGLGLMDEDRMEPGTLDVSRPDMNRLRETLPRTGAALISSGGVGYLVQPLGDRGRVFIFGAGHVARELAPLCDRIGLATVIVDDRPEFASAERFPAAQEILVPESFQDCIGGRDIGEECCLVIVTRGHEHDRTVLAQALRTRAGYIGMIGSREKRDITYRTLMAEGFRAEDLSRVHCPIGLGIGAQTPAEIAVSIVAELIAVRSGTGVSRPDA